MLLSSSFKPEHINATLDDLKGNYDIGRYILLPGSNGRAKKIASYFDNVSEKRHPRGHHLYLGTLNCEGKSIDVATVATGMGCPSTEIILHELFHLGAKRFLRIGTAGSMQSPRIKEGDLINATAAVRDEGTTRDYVPIEFPAIASLEFASSILLAADKLDLADRLYTGIVHCKDSLYAKEFGAGPRQTENTAYVNQLAKAGVLASEMETATLFIQSHLYNAELMNTNDTTPHRVLAGAILTIINDGHQFNTTTNHLPAIKRSIELGIESIKTLAIQELFA